MNAHQIQLAINVVRGEAARGRPGRAVRLAALLLDHLRGASDELPAPLPVTRPPVRLAALPATLVEVLAAQTLGEVALALATVGDSRWVAGLLRKLAPLTTEGRSALWERMGRWVQIKTGVVEGVGDRFLDDSRRFLAEGTGDLPLPWASIVADQIRLCEHRDDCDSVAFRTEAGHDLSEWAWVPALLRPRTAGCGLIAAVQDVNAGHRTLTPSLRR